MHIHNFHLCKLSMVTGATSNDVLFMVVFALALKIWLCLPFISILTLSLYAQTVDNAFPSPHIMSNVSLNSDKIISHYILSRVLLPHEQCPDPVAGQSRFGAATPFSDYKGLLDDKHDRRTKTNCKPESSEDRTKHKE